MVITKVLINVYEEFVNFSALSLSIFASGMNKNKFMYIASPLADIAGQEPCAGKDGKCGGKERGWTSGYSAPWQIATYAYA